MTRIGYMSLLTLFMISCGGGGVTITKSRTVEYVSNAFNKSKQWLRSTDGDYIPQEGPPRPPLFSLRKVKFCKAGQNKAQLAE